MIWHGRTTSNCQNRRTNENLLLKTKFKKYKTQQNVVVMVKMLRLLEFITVLLACNLLLHFNYHHGIPFLNNSVMYAFNLKEFDFIIHEGLYLRYLSSHKPNHEKNFNYIHKFDKFVLLCYFLCVFLVFRSSFKMFSAYTRHNVWEYYLLLGPRC